MSKYLILIALLLMIIVNTLAEDKLQIGIKKKVENSFEIELDILKKFNSFGIHPNIIRLIGYYKNLNENKFYIILEYCNGGSLEKYLNSKINIYSNNNNMIFKLSDLKRLFKDIIYGLKFLHENGYSHLDLKVNITLLFIY